MISVNELIDTIPCSNESLCYDGLDIFVAHLGIVTADFPIYTSHVFISNGFKNVNKM